MLFNQTSEYALRAMAVLATREQVPCLAEELASEAHIPAHYVSKVMRRLVVAGLVTSKRGRGGGFSLAQEPHAIRFAQIFAATDVVLEGGTCVFGMGLCDLEAPCVLHPTWSKLKEQIGDWAEETTLGDLKQGAPVPAILPLDG